MIRNKAYTKVRLTYISRSSKISALLRILCTIVSVSMMLLPSGVSSPESTSSARSRIMKTGGGGESFGVFDNRVTVSDILDSRKGASPILSSKVVTAVSSLRILIKSKYIRYIV
jgi:hypothetical protein